MLIEDAAASISPGLSPTVELPTIFEAPGPLLADPTWLEGGLGTCAKARMAEHVMHRASKTRRRQLDIRRFQPHKECTLCVIHNSEGWRKLGSLVRQDDGAY